ncbi:Hsp70 family protein [Longispora sp. K20-0274]|uniref:Hsp70 family protein n=1 Tax=Longispora sp. K20-0274 TaxID=3088255 RepID=UPI00399A3B97
MSGFRLGVDYGTSHTVAVLGWPDGRCRPLHFGASELLPSAVFAAEDGLVTGSDALRAGRLDPASLEPNPKRRIDDGEVLLGTTPVPVTALVAATLRTVWTEAVRVAGCRPDGVVLTCPAGWGGPRRAILAEAAAQAGMVDPVLVAEPVAAATAFVARFDDRIPVGRCAVVYDLGAGTFDTSVVRRTPEGFSVLATGGLGDFGGLDLDALVVERVGVALTRSEPELWRRLTTADGVEDRRARQLLWTEARHAKETLSRRSTAQVHVPVLNRAVHVGREEFERAAAGPLGDTAALMTRTVAEAGVDWAEVAGVFLVGGASRVPLVSTVVHRACGVAPSALEQPELVVAEGSLLIPTPAPFPSDVPTVRGIVRLVGSRPPEPARVSAGGRRWRRPAVVSLVAALLLLLLPMLPGDGASPRVHGGAPPAAAGRSPQASPDVSPGPGPGPAGTAQPSGTPADLVTPPPDQNRPTPANQQPPAPGQPQPPASQAPASARTTGAVLEIDLGPFGGYCTVGYLKDVAYTVRIQTSPGDTDTHYVLSFGDGQQVAGDARTDQGGSAVRTGTHDFRTQNGTKTYYLRFQTTTPSAMSSNTVALEVPCAP